MRPLSLLALCLLPALSRAATASVSFDNNYDNKALPLDDVACSNGANGLETRFGFTTIGQLPTWPRVGGATAVAGFNSPNCGTCWTLTFNGTNVTITAIDHAVGFNIAQAALDQLTHGNAVQFGRVNATFVQVANSVCGL